MESTKEIKVPEKILDQVIGQDEAVNIIKKASLQRRHVLLIGEPGTGKCVGKNTLISTTEGPIKAEDLFKKLSQNKIIKDDGTYASPSQNIYVHTLDTNNQITSRKIIKLYKGQRKKVLKIITNSGAEAVISGDHPLLSIRNNQALFLPSEELSKDSWVGLARKLPYLTKTSSEKKENYFQYKGKNGRISLNIKIPPEIDEELAYFLGIYVAEGRWQGNIKIYNQNKEIQQKIKQILLDKFFYPSQYIEINSNEVYIRRSRSLIEVLNKNYQIPIETQKQSSNKIIPEEIFTASSKVSAAFLSGYIDGDGYISKTGGFQCVSASKLLIEQLRLLLLKWGIHSRIKTTIKYAANTLEKRKHQYYSLNILDSENLKKLNQILNLTISYKKENLHNYSNKKSNTNIDVIPDIGQLLHNIKQSNKLTYFNLNLYHATLDKIRNRERQASRELVQRLTKKFKSDFSPKNPCSSELKQLELLSNNDIFWDKIKEISLVEEDMYDFEIEELHNYIIDGGLIIHNSMLGLALAELLPKEKLLDTISLPNPNDENAPLIKTIQAGQGRDEVKKSQLQTKQLFKNQNFLFFILAIAALVAPWWIRYRYQSDLMFTAFFLGSMLFLVGLVFLLNMGPRMMNSQKIQHPKLIVDNFDQKQAPFFDATGSHAGALLGDILHDPFQTFSYTSIQKCKLKNNTNLNNELKEKFKKFKDKIEKRDSRKNYEAIHLPKNELSVLGETNSSVSPVEVLSSNRYDHNSEMIKLTTSENKELIITPEHKIAIWKSDKISYKEAKKIKKGDQAVAKAEDIIIDEQDIINTYDQRQQEQCKLYYQYKKIKKENPSWGYKRIAKAMNQPEAKTRWWNSGKCIPTPIQTANWLKRRKLIPLKIDNPKLPLIAKIIGATFGDGGIFENLNAIFLSSSELQATQEFGNDLINIFGYSIDNNMRTIRGGVNKTSFCYQNTNRNIIRFFKALEAPTGKKTNLKLNIPQWIYTNKIFEKEFFSSLLGSEIGVPNIHKSGTQLNTFDFAITGKDGLSKNRTNFLNEIRDYLESHGVKTGEIKTRIVQTIKQNKKSTLYRFLISTEFGNLINFSKNCGLNYCDYKRTKLIKTINVFKTIKRHRYNELLSQGYGAESIMKKLRLSPAALYTILNEERIIP